MTRVKFLTGTGIFLLATIARPAIEPTQPLAKYDTSWYKMKIKTKGIMPFL
jgi:hypothetical protein